MSNVLLLIAIVFPLVMAPIVKFLKIPVKVKDWVNLGVVITTSILSFTVIFLNPSESFSIFKFSDSLPVELKLDNLGRIFAGMVSLLWPFAFLYTIEYMSHDDKKRSYSMFYIMTFGVVLGISFASNLITLYFFYELLTLITLPLVIFTFTKEAKRATRFYLYISLFGSTIALFGILTLYTQFGILNFVGFNETVNNIAKVGDKKPLVYAAYLLMFFGFGVKAAIFPLHKWLPTAGVAPTPTTALLHTVAVVKAGAFAIIRTIYSAIGVELLSGTPVQIITILFASFTIVFGSAMALKQNHLKRRYAYSTISNISYIILAACMMNETGIYAAILHLLFHSFAKISIFFTAGVLMHQADITYIDQIDGLGKKMPITFTLYTLSSLSLTGIPLFSGFISKLEIANATISVGTWYSLIGLIAIFISAMFTAVYTIDLVIRAFFKKPTEYNMENFEMAKEGSYKFLIPISTFAIISVFLGTFAAPFLELIKSLLQGGGL